MKQTSGESGPAADSVLYVVGGSGEQQRSLVALVGRLGRDVVIAGSAEELLAKLPFSKPFVLISAVSLPGMSGMDLLKELRRQGIPAPTILISESGDISMAVDAIHAGATDFIERPYIDRILLRRVQSALEMSDAA